MAYSKSSSMEVIQKVFMVFSIFVTHEYYEKKYGSDGRVNKLTVQLINYKLLYLSTQVVYLCTYYTYLCMNLFCKYLEYFMNPLWDSRGPVGHPVGAKCM